MFNNSKIIGKLLKGTRHLKSKTNISCLELLINQVNYNLMIEMVFYGITYVVMVYFMVILMKKKRDNPTGDDDKDGGIGVTDLPDIDLPPGITLPDGPHKEVKKDRLEEIFV